MFVFGLNGGQDFPHRHKESFTMDNYLLRGNDREHRNDSVHH